MIRVAFFAGHYSRQWMGGVNYLHNLLFAIAQLEDKKIEPVVFLGNKTDKDILKKFRRYAQVVQDPVFDTNSIKWLSAKFLEIVFNSSLLIDPLLRKNNINVISHSNALGGFNQFVKINWIADFQHVHLAHFFTRKENKQRDAFFKKIFRKSDQVIVSSHNAYHDAEKFSPDYIDKVQVLQFVAQPDKNIFSLNADYLTQLEDKFNFQGKFFYIPNQLWKHKNHLLVFAAVKLLKAQGIDVLIICSGYMHDYRNPDYIDEVTAFIEDNQLQENIKLLGLIDYQEVLYFMRYCIAVINPSLFEGWSSTVEECKSIGKNMLLSDIAIHREQDPQQSLYFDPHNSEALAQLLKKICLDEAWNGPNKLLEKQAATELRKRTITFAQSYQKIVLESMQWLKK